MVLTDQVKNYARKLVEDHPDRLTLRKLVRSPKMKAILFKDDGVVPNNPRFPLIVYRGAIALRQTAFDPATIIDSVFESNGWGQSWRDTVYDFVHYHSQIHKVMGVARGSGRIECGGVKGRILKVKAGDVVILPAGTGHRLIEASRDFLVVGAYLKDGTYDECTDTRERPKAIKRIVKVRKPRKDPVYGASGPVTRAWQRTKRK